VRRRRAESYVKKCHGVLKRNVFIQRGSKVGICDGASANECLGAVRRLTSGRCAVGMEVSLEGTVKRASERY